MELLTMKQVMQRLGITDYRTMQGIFDRGELPFVKIGCRKFCRAADVEAYLMPRVQEVHG